MSKQEGKERDNVAEQTKFDDLVAHNMKALWSCKVIKC